MEWEPQWTSDGEFDLEATIDEVRLSRPQRNVPPNPPPLAAHKGWISGKTICTLTVPWVAPTLYCVRVGLDLVERANQKNGLCFPSNRTVASRAKIADRTVRRATMWWREHGYHVNGKPEPFLTIAVKGKRNQDGKGQSNAYHIGWMALISWAANHHPFPTIRQHAAAIVTAETSRLATVVQYGGSG